MVWWTQGNANYCSIYFTRWLFELIRKMHLRFWKC